jgi:hypothetical protein
MRHAFQKHSLILYRVRQNFQDFPESVGGLTIFLKIQIGQPHAMERPEVEGVQTKSLLTIGNGFPVAMFQKVQNCPLVPSFGKVGHGLDELIQEQFRLIAIARFHQCPRSVEHLHPDHSLLPEPKLPEFTGGRLSDTLLIMFEIIEQRMNGNAVHEQGG